MNPTSHSSIPNTSPKSIPALFAILAIARCALAADYTVNSATDSGAFLSGVGSGTSGDLRYCIVQANANPGSTITLNGLAVALNSELPPITAPVLIQALNGTSISGQGSSRIFFVDAPGATVTIQNILLRDAKAKGGNGGGGGGGGGLGAGAAVFVNAGTVVCSNLSIQNVAAEGGQGGSTAGTAGGGGGLGGNGGTNYGGGGGFRGPGGNGGTVDGGQAGWASGGGGGISGSAGNGGQAGGGGGGGTVNANGTSGGGGGGNGGSNYSNKNGANGTLYGGGGGAGSGLSGPSCLGGNGGKFGGGGGGSNNSDSNGGNGGEFGGGGAGSLAFSGNSPGGRGGSGGFGGGGGSGGFSGGPAGFGGGSGGKSNTPTSGGGGGSAFGGAIFVRSGNGAHLHIQNTGLPAGTLIAGAGGASAPFTNQSPGAPGLAAGSAVYFHGTGGDFMVDTSVADRTIDGSIVSDMNVGLQKNGLMTLTLTAPNDYRGTTVNYGTLKLSGAGNLGHPTRHLSTYLSGTCDLNGTHQTVGPIFGTNGGRITNNAAGTVSILTVGNGDTHGDFEGYLRDGTGQLSLRKIGTGTQVLRHANTHTGLTEVLGGTLVLDTGFSTGPIIPAGSTLSISNAAVRMNGSQNNALGQGPILIKAGGVLSAENSGSAVHHLGPLTLQGGTVTGGSPDSGQPNLIIANDVTAEGNLPSTISMPRGQILGARTFHVSDGAAAHDLTLSTALVDHFLYPGGIVKSGAGTLHLTGRSSYSQGTVVNGGVLSAGIGGYTGPFPAGSTVTVNNGGTLLCSAGDCLGYFDGNAKLVLNPGAVLTTNGEAGMFNWLNDITLTGATVTSPPSGGGFLLAGPLKTLASTTTSVISSKALAIYPGYAAPATFEIAAGSAPGGIDLHISSPVSGGGGEPLIKKGSGVMLLSSANTYAGGTRLEGGTLAISHPDALGGGPIHFALGVLRFDGIAPDISHRIQNPASNAFPIRINTNGQQVTFASPLGGPAPLGKSGAGTLTLAAVNTYTGGTNVNAGTVAVASSGRLGPGPVNIAAGATLDLRAFGSGGYPMPAGTTITNNGTILGSYYFIGSPPDIVLSHPAGTELSSGATVPFTEQRLGNSQAKTFTLQNIGAGSLLISDVSIVSGNSADFLINTSGMATALATTPGSNSTTFTVTFQPTTAGGRSAVLRVATNDPDEAAIDVTLTGNGFIPPKLEVEIPPASPFTQLPALAWGENNLNQTNIPAAASNIAALASGRWHTLALSSDGTVAAWGYNGDGQTHLPADLGTVTSVAAGGYHSLALRSDGTVRAWGFNGNGQCTIPAGLGSVTAIAAGERTSVAVRQNGTVAVWGATSDGMTSIPAAATQIRSAVAGLSHIAALRSDGTVIAWGRIAEGQAVVPAGLTGVKALAAGNDHTLALKEDGTVTGWGYNGNQQLNIPAGLSSVQAIAAGGNTSLALKTDGTVIAWGQNHRGQATIPAAATGVSAISAGWEFAVAARTRFVEFGQRPIATTGNTQIIIRNTGGRTLNLSNLSVTGGASGDFSSPQLGQPLSIAAASQVALDLAFNPGGTGPRIAALVFATNDPDTPGYTLPLRGTGTVNPHAAWRQTWFGITTNTGNAADDFDFDHDGVPNLLEFAFGLNPTAPDASGLPQPVITASSIRYEFTTPPGVVGSQLRYFAEFSEDLIDWTEIPDAGSGLQHSFSLELNGSQRVFLRLGAATDP